MSTQPYPVRMVRTYGKLLAPRVTDVEMTADALLCVFVGLGGAPDNYYSHNMDDIGGHNNSYSYY